MYYCKIGTEYVSRDLFGQVCFLKHTDLAVKDTKENWERRIRQLTGNPMELVELEVVQ